MTKDIRCKFCEGRMRFVKNIARMLHQYYDPEEVMEREYVWPLDELDKITELAHEVVEHESNHHEDQEDEDQEDEDG